MAFKPKILVVEDDEQMLRLLGEVLAQMGAEPYCEGSSVHAAELAEHEKFDGVFLDWKMPELDGLELATATMVGIYPRATQRAQFGNGADVRVSLLCLDAEPGGAAEKRRGRLHRGRL